MDDQTLIKQLNARSPGFIPMLGGRIVAINREEQSCTFEFSIGTDFCHSIDVVQGGFVTSMLDAAMSHAVFAIAENIVSASSLAINTSYLEVTRAGRLRAVGKVVKSSHKTVFLEGQLYNEEGRLTATTNAVAKLTRKS